MAWGSTLFFGLCVVAAIVQLLPGSSFLRLSSEGMMIRAMWRETFYRWSDIERFGVAVIRPAGHRQLMVGLNFSQNSQYQDKAVALRSLNRELTGFEGALPDNYGWDCARLAAHLEAWKARWTGAPAPTEPA